MINDENYKESIISEKPEIHTGDKYIYFTILPNHIEVREIDFPNFLLRSKFKDFKELYSLIVIGNIDLQAECERRQEIDYFYIPMAELF